MTATTPNEINLDGPAPDLHYVIAGLKRRTGVMVITGAVALSLVIGFLAVMPRTYTASSAVMLDTRKRQVVDTEAVLSGLSADTNVTETEVELFRSRSLAAKVAQDLKLQNDPEFNPALEGSANPVKAFIQGLVSPGQARPVMTPDETMRRVEDQLLSNLKVSRVGTTYVIRLSYSSSSPRTAAIVANRYAERYLLEQLETKFDATAQANAWITSRLASLRDQLSAAEGEVERYRSANGLLSAVGTPLTEQEISNLNRELATARVEYADRSARANSARRGSNERLGEALNSDVVKDLRRQQSVAKAKLADLNARYGPRHPLVAQAQGDELKIQVQIDDEVKRIVGNLDTEREVAAERLSSLQRSLNAARGTLVGNNAASVKLRELERNAESVRTLYESFLSRAKVTGADATLQTPDSRIIARAATPETPSFPKVSTTLALGVMLALFCALAAGVIAELLDVGFGTSESVERFLDLPLLASVPLTPRGTKRRGVARTVVDKPMSAYAEAFRNIRAHLLVSPETTGARVIMVTSALPNEGKSTTALSLARILALAGDRVLIIDTDLRRNVLASSVDAEPTAGLMEVLNGDAAVETALIQDELTSLMLLPLTGSATAAADLIGGPAMDALLAKVRGEFRYVILDCPPVLPLADARLLSSKADLVLFLVQWRKTPRRAAKAAIDILRSVGARSIVGALSQVDLEVQSRQGYGDQFYYYRSYKDYYLS
jgi:capsular exopolysaccharide synthesis family protein